MSQHQKLSHESMKELTEKIIKADLASRKRKMIHFNSVRLTGVVWVPIVFFKTLYGQSVLKSVNNQTGDPYNIWKNIFGLNYNCTRQLFRPEIFYQDQNLRMKEYAQFTAKEVAKDEKLTFKPYVWN